jgi:hypothetical protein
VYFLWKRHHDFQISLLSIVDMHHSLALLRGKYMRAAHSKAIRCRCTLLEDMALGRQWLVFVEKDASIFRDARIRLRLRGYRGGKVLGEHGDGDGAGKAVTVASFVAIFFWCWGRRTDGDDAIFWPETKLSGEIVPKTFTPLQAGSQLINITSSPHSVESNSPCASVPSVPRMPLIEAVEHTTRRTRNSGQIVQSI